MQETCGNIKTILEAMQGSGLSSTAKLVAILESCCGIVDRIELESLIECRPSTLREARSALKNQRWKSSSAGKAAPEIQRSAGKAAQTLEIQRQNSSAPSCAGATKELPSEVVIPRRLEQQQQQQVPPVEKIHSAVMAAAGEALNPVSIGLNVVSDVIGWINQGADLDLDIVPTIAAISIGKRHCVNSWRFYASAVSNATSARKRGLPPPIEASGKVVHFRPTDTSGRPIRTTSEVLAMIAAEDAAHAAL